MERRDWSIKLLNELIFIDSLDSYEKADRLVSWYEEHFSSKSIEDVDLELDDLKKLEELFFKSINFLKEHKISAKEELTHTQKLRKFLNN